MTSTLLLMNHVKHEWVYSGMVPTKGWPHCRDPINLDHKFDSHDSGFPTLVQPTK